MFNASDMMILVGVLLALVFCGFHIAVSLGVTSLLGIWLVNGDWQTVQQFSANTAYEALRDYVFAVIPLFMLMGEFLAKCGAARDLFSLVNRLTRWLPGRLGVATVLANAVFAFVTWVNSASMRAGQSAGGCRFTTASIVPSCFPLFVCRWSTTYAAAASSATSTSSWPPCWCSSWVPTTSSSSSAGRASAWRPTS